MLHQLRAQDQLLIVGFNHSERAFSQLNREVLRMITLVKISPYQVDSESIQRQSNLLNSRVMIVLKHNIDSDVVSGSVEADRKILKPQWEELDRTLQEWMKQPQNSALRLSLSEQLENFEITVNDMVARHNFQRREQYVTLSQRRTDAIHLIFLIAICFLMLVGLAIVTTSRFIQDRQKMLGIVRDREEKYRRIIETSEEGIWLLDPQGNTIFANKKMAYLLGLTEMELQGMSLWKFFATHAEIHQAQAYFKRLRDGERSPYDLCLTRPDGQAIWLLTNGAPILDEAGQDTGTLCMLTDVTARKQSEQELQVAKQRAEVANQAKSDFLACMSHELRTPLNGILGYAQVLRRSPNLSPQDNNGINIIYQCGSHLLTLINDILDLSKIEAQKLELLPTVLDLSALMQQVVAICCIRAEQKGINFIYVPDPTLPPQIEADEKRLRQVLINLVGNAIKFTEEGSVTLRIDRLERSPTSVLLSFHIIDTGIGIAPDDTQKLFQAFEQVGDRHKQNDGTGLGLVISQRLVQLMGGQIQVNSQLGQGSEFSFCLRFPLSLGTAAPLHYAHEKLDLPRLDSSFIIGYRRLGNQPSDDTRCTILVIDHHWQTQSMLLDLLEPIGFSLLTADNGREGLVQLQARQPDLVITAIAMPEMDGLEFLRQLRHRDDLKHIPVIVSSSLVSPNHRQAAIQQGGNAFLPKPMDSQVLLRLLATHLQLEWVYADPEIGNPELENDRTTQSTSSDLVLPPTKVLLQLLELAERDNIRILREQLKQLIETDQVYSPFATKLDRLAKRFQTEDIETLLQKYLAEGVVNAG
ncbi:MAG: ATP-binding protein [Leptolyngbyaceae bacterium]|nr:ATP-binding protein [Leptolyngbyaceae bacterium]